MLESTVVVLDPLLRGTHQRARSPLGAQAYKGESEMFMPLKGLRKPTAEHQAIGQPSPSRLLFATRLVPVPP